MKFKKAFTMIELLIVMTITSILATSGLSSWEQDINYKIKEKFVDDIEHIISLQERIKSKDGNYVEVNFESDSETMSKESDGYNFTLSFAKTILIITTYDDCFEIHSEQKNIEKTIKYDNCTDSKLRII